MAALCLGSLPSGTHVGVTPNKICALVIVTLVFICFGQLSVTITNTSVIHCINRKSLFVSVWEVSAHDWLVPLLWGKKI